ncbi:TolC family protein [Phenylobacterium hankyongense]|uniref:TolC family protein n=1 Tax=Phenylobacterium hankyongense TaxID=1813876 RepID=A0A328AYC0_9CAUL|nr:TolC family protein [Phenylobacterium hankyongense]
MRPAFPAVLVACIALAACASVRTADVRLPAAFEAPPGAAADAVALDRWWTAFNDPQLTGLVEQALAANPDARSAAARLDEARATRTSALVGFLPQGNLAGSAKKTHSTQLAGTPIDIPGFSTSGDSEAYSGTFNVSWELDLFGRIFAARRAANADVAAARFDYEATRASLAAQVADAYFQARGLAIQLADAHETARIERSLYDIATRRAQAGLAATADADRVAGDLSQADAQVAALEAQLQAQRRTLLILAGRTVEPTANIDVPPSVGAPPPVPAAVPSQLLARRPDVRRAQAQVASAAGRLDVAKLAFLPTFTLTPGVGWSKNVQPGFFAETSNWSIGAGVTQPVLNIPNLLAQLHIQNARTEQSVIAYEKAVQTAFSESEGALVNLDADRRRVAILTEGEARAARAAKASRIGYDRGLNDLQTTLSTEQSWRSVRSQLTAAQVQALRRAVQAYKALGGGWPAQAFPSIAQAR